MLHDDLSSHVDLIHTPEPNLSRARNTAVQSAKHDVILFLDDDCIASDSWAAGLVSFLQTHLGCVAVFGSVLPAQHPAGQAASLETTQTKYGHNWRGVSASGDQCFAVVEHHEGQGSGRILPYAVVGSTNSFAVRRSTAHDPGTFDESLGPGCLVDAAEDQEWLYRASAAGHLIGRTGTSLAHHDNWQSIEQANRTLDRYCRGNVAVFTSFALEGDIFAARVVGHLLATNWRPLSDAGGRASATEYATRLAHLIAGLGLGLQRGVRTRIANRTTRGRPAPRQASTDAS